MGRSSRDSEEIRAWRRALDERCAAPTAVDPARVRAIEALVADCPTGFEAWERLVAHGALSVDWLHDERRRFAVRADVLTQFKRARFESLDAERVVVDGGTSRLAAHAPAHKDFAVRLASRAAVLDEAERLARIADAQLRRFSGESTGPERAPRVLWVHGAPAQRAHHTTRVARSMQTRVVLLYSAVAIGSVMDLAQTRALVARVRSLGWQFAQGDHRVHCALQRERWALLLDALASAERDGALEVRVDLSGLDGTRVLRVEPHERDNPFVALAALEALGVTLSASGPQWIELSIPSFSGL